jgi:hypothetical protein
MDAAERKRRTEDGGLSRRGFVAGLLGAGGALALPGAAIAAAASGEVGLLFSQDHRALALSHGGEQLGLLSFAAGEASPALLHARRQSLILTGLDGYLADVQAAWTTGPRQFALLDGRRRRLHRYSIDGAALDTTALTVRTPLLAAAGCADGAGGSFVSLPGEHCIARLGANGVVQQRFGTLGRAPGQLNHPTALARQDDGSLIVANSGNYRIDRFHADGRFAGTVARFRFMPCRLALSGATLAVYDPHAAQVLLLSSCSGEQTAALAVPKMRAGSRQCHSLTAAGTQRFLVSV